MEPVGVPGQPVLGQPIGVPGQPVPVESVGLPGQPVAGQPVGEPGEPVAGQPVEPGGVLWQPAGVPGQLVAGAGSASKAQTCSVPGCGAAGDKKWGGCSGNMSTRHSRLKSA